jgi:Ca2+-binding RTX toxin-like protein
LNGNYRVSSNSYDGLGGSDALLMSTDSDYLDITQMPGSVQNIEKFFGSGGNDVINLTGYSLDTEIRASAGDGLVWAGEGNDDIRSFAGNDIIDGGPGEDIIWMRYGANTVNGGDDADWIFHWANGSVAAGGSGLDVFSFFLGAEPSSLVADTITDFQPGDILDLSSFLDLAADGVRDFDIGNAAVIFEQAGLDTVVKVSGDGTAGSAFPVVRLNDVIAASIVGHTVEDIPALMDGQQYYSFENWSTHLVSNAFFTVKAVPLPAAFWLFASALSLLFGRRQLANKFKAAA